MVGLCLAGFFAAQWRLRCGGRGVRTYPEETPLSAGGRRCRHGLDHVIPAGRDHPLQASAEQGVVDRDRAVGRRVEQPCLQHLPGEFASLDQRSLKLLLWNVLAVHDL